MRFLLKYFTLFAMFFLAACGGDSSSVSSEEEVPASSSSSEGKDSSFYQSDVLTDFRNGQSYSTVSIGSKIWMVDNLNYDYNVGSAKSFCYNHQWDNCVGLGRLYTWAAAVDSAALFSSSGADCGFGNSCKKDSTVLRGACPKGWHLPSVLEYQQLLAKVGESDHAGKILKSTYGWSQDGFGSDSVGFKILPAGYYLGGGFYAATEEARFWTVDEEGAFIGMYYSFLYNYEKAFLNSEYKYYGFSVRCIKDS